MKQGKRDDEWKAEDKAGTEDGRTAKERQRRNGTQQEKKVRRHRRGYTR